MKRTMFSLIVLVTLFIYTALSLGSGGGSLGGGGGGGPETDPLSLHRDGTNYMTGAVSSAAATDLTLSINAGVDPVLEMEDETNVSTTATVSLSCAGGDGDCSIGLPTGGAASNARPEFAYLSGGIVAGDSTVKDVIFGVAGFQLWQGAALIGEATGNAALIGSPDGTTGANSVFGFATSALHMGFFRSMEGAAGFDERDICYVTTSTAGVIPGDTANNRVCFKHNNDLVMQANGKILPGTDNLSDIGATGFRFKDIYASNTVIIGSTMRVGDGTLAMDPNAVADNTAAKSMTFTSGNKTAVGTSGDGGSMTFTAGESTSGVTTGNALGDGGNITFTAGDSDVLAGTDNPGEGGDISFVAGNAINQDFSAATAGDGGNIVFIAGSSYADAVAGDGASGDIKFYAGSSASEPIGEIIFGVTDGFGGNSDSIRINPSNNEIIGGGIRLTATVGGEFLLVKDVSLSAGDGAGNGGDVTIEAGDASAANNGGDMVFTAGNGGSGAGTQVGGSLTFTVGTGEEGSGTIFLGGDIEASGNLDIGGDLTGVENLNVVGLLITEMVGPTYLTVDNQVVTATRNVVELRSDTPIATDRTFTLANGTQGQHLIVYSGDGGPSPNAFELADTGNACLSADWTPGLRDSIMLFWDSVLPGCWTEVSRSDN